MSGRWASVVVLALLLAGCRKPPPLPHCQDAVTAVVPTQDGASVRLHRHAASGPPVLLVHGLGSRGQYWDATAERSLAVHLHARGFDVWLLDLRGHGGHQQTATGERLRVGWTLDDYGRYDLLAALQHIQRVTGHAQVGYVGHSMGGMVLAAYHAWHGDAALSAAVVLGSPVDFHHRDPLVDLALGALGAGQVLPAFDTPAMARLVHRRGLPPAAAELLFNPANLDETTQKALFLRGTGPVSRGEMRQLQETLRTGDFAAMDGSRHYVAALSTFTTPLLVVAGRRDAIAPPDRVRPYYDHAGSPHKVWQVAGRDSGFAVDYGHLDLTAGVHAPAEIFPRVDAWLRDHAAPAQKLPATTTPAAPSAAVGAQ